MSHTPPRNVRAALLDSAQKLMQQRGFNAVSYGELSRQVGVTTATIHYYFPAKADLATALIERYSEQLRAQLDALNATSAEPLERLERFAASFQATLADEERLCLGGVFAADLASLPFAAQRGVRSFFTLAETWLAAVIAEGAASGALRPTAAPAALAQSILAMLEGAMLLARAFDDQSRLHRLDAAIKQLVGAASEYTGGAA